MGMHRYASCNQCDGKICCILLLSVWLSSKFYPDMWAPKTRLKRVKIKNTIFFRCEIFKFHTVLINSRILNSFLDPSVMIIIACLRVIHCRKNNKRNARKRTKEVIRRGEKDEELESDLGRDGLSSGV
jgi:hypothetical protein